VIVRNIHTVDYCVIHTKPNMFKSLGLGQAAKTLSRGLHTRREVMVSQTRDILANSALEEWAGRNIEMTNKSILLLTNNITRNRGVDIKATFFLGREEEANMTDMETMVFESLPRDLLMVAPPVTSVNHLIEEGGQRCISVHLELVKEVKTKIVLTALEQIGKKFLGESSIQRIKLVRPDNEWFPGLGEVKAELERTMKEVEMIKRSNPRPVSPFKDPSSSGTRNGAVLQTSFGN